MKEIRIGNNYGIANWKIESDEERRLAERADYSDSAKREYAEFYRADVMIQSITKKVFK